jgi:hypothetical protein
MNVDGTGWSELTDAYMELYERVAEIQTAAAERMSGGRRGAGSRPQLPESF